MATYLILNLLVSLSLLLIIRDKRIFRGKLFINYLSLLILLTIVFDNLIIISEIVGYNDSLILNIRVVKAPIEDFAYTLFAAILIPYVWELSGE